MADLAQIGFRAETGDLDKATKKLNTMADTGERSEKRINKSVSNVNSEFVRLGNTIGLVSAGIISIGIVSKIADITDANRDFSRSISELSAITGAVGDDLEFYSEQARAIGASTTLSATESAQAFKLMASAKPDLLASADALNSVTREAVVLAEATGIDLASSAKILGSTLNQFSLDASEAKEVINLLAASSQQGTASVQSISESLVNAGSAANTLDVSLTETIAGLQSLAKAGIEGAQAGTALNQIMLRLERSGDQALMPSVVGLTAAISNLNDMHLSTTETMKFFGDEAFKSAAALMNQEETLLKLNKTLGGTNIAYEQAATIVDNWDGDLKKLDSTIESLSISIGERLDPTLRTATQGFNDLIGDFDRLVNAAEAGAAVIGGAMVISLGKSAAATAATAASTVAYNIKLAEMAGLTGAYAVQAGIAATATNALGVATRFLLGPWGLLLTAVGAAATAFSLSKDSASELKTELERQKGAVSGLVSEYEKMSNRAIGSAYIAAQKTLIEIDQQRLDLNEKISDLAGKSDPASFGMLQSLKTQLANLDKQALTSEQRLDAINQIFEKGLSTIKWTNGLKKTSQEISNTSAEFKKWKEQVEGFLTPAQKLQAEIDKINKGLLSGDLTATSGLNAYLDSLNSQLDKFNEKAKDTSYQDWINGIESSTGQLQKLQDEITEVWLAMDAGDISADAGLEFIDQLEERIKDLKDTVEKEDIFGSVTDSIGESLVAMQALHEQGTTGYRDITIAIQAVTAAQKVAAIASAATLGTILGAVGAIAGLLGAISSMGEIEATFKETQASQGLNIWGEKSESIANSIDITADATEKLVGINTDMLKALQSLQSGIAGAAGITARASAGVDFDVPQMFNSNVLSGFTGSFFGGLMDDLTFGIFGGIFNAIGKLLGGSQKVTDEGVQIIGGTINELIDNTLVQAFQEVKVKKYAWSSTKTKLFFEELNEASAQFGLVFDSLATTVFEAGKTLGMNSAELENAINSFEIETTKISLKGLGIEEQQAEIEAVFSKIFDDLATDVIPFAADFQRAGEGMGETLTRLATEVSIADFAVKNLGVSLGDKLADPQMYTQIADNLANMTGGIEEFADKIASFVDNFAPESVRFEINSDAFNEQMQAVGLEIPDTREGFFNLMSSIEAVKAEMTGLTQIYSGGVLVDEWMRTKTVQDEMAQEQIAAILNVQDIANEYYDMLEDRESDAAAQLESDLAKQEALRNKSANLTIELLRLQGDEAAALAMQREMELAAMDESLRPLKELIYAEEDRSSALKEAAEIEAEAARVAEEAARVAAQLESDRANLTVELLRLQGNETEALAMQRELELSAMDESLRALQLSIYAQEDRNIALEKATAIEAEAARVAEEAAQAAAQLESDRANLTIELLKLQGRESEALAMQREIELAATDDQLKSLQRLIYSEEDRISALDAQNAAINEQIAALGLLEDAASSSYSALEKSIQLEKDRAQASLDAAREANEAEKERVNSLISSLNTQKELLDSNLSASQKALEKSFEAEKARFDEVISNIEAEKDAVSKSFADRMSAVGDSISMLTSLTDNLNSAVNSAFGKSQDVDAALAAARAGDFSAAAALDLSNIFQDAGAFSSAEDFAFSQAVTAGKLSELADLSSNQKTIEERTLLSLESQERSAMASLDAQIASAEAQKVALDNQLNGILGIDNSVLALTDSIDGYNAAKLELDSLNYDSELAKFDMMLQSADDVYALHEQAYNEQISNLDALQENGEMLLNTALNIDASVATVPDALEALKQAVTEALEKSAEVNSKQAADTEITNKAIAKALSEQTFLLQQIEDNGAQAL